MTGNEIYGKREVSPQGESVGKEYGTEVESSDGFLGGIGDVKLEGY